LEGMAGGSAGGDGRRSVERRNPKVSRRRKLRIGRMVGPEGCWKAQAEERQDGWPLDLTPIFSRRLRWKATPEGRQTTQVGGQLESEAEGTNGGASRRLAGRLGRRVVRRRKP
jgi:hypothetical protein